MYTFSAKAWLENFRSDMLAATEGIDDDDHLTEIVMEHVDDYLPALLSEEMKIVQEFWNEMGDLDISFWEAYTLDQALTAAMREFLLMQGLDATAR